MTRFSLIALVALALAGCAGEGTPATEVGPSVPAPVPATQTVLDTTGAAPDTTGFFDEAEAAVEQVGTHTHDDGTTHDH